ncbi:hypothetical protein SV7mr_34230 [Stieleria bergensis]|uniref:DUF1574 domain-containing protein n=1 Tax=Stieleria bergensis TaxID=2528025 RepID=A0A517SXN2_9BACT|nr:hypothetical protein SV7mr_34230 [Planctomycetes bacterium SV_7m_r]
MNRNSFIFNSNESLAADSPAVRIPVAVIVAIVAVVVIEFFLWHNVDWYSDQAAKYWLEKDGTQNSTADVMFLGSSVTLHSVNPLQVDSREVSTSNLALNGCRTNQQYFLLKRQLMHLETPPSHVVIELRAVDPNHQSWLYGPSFRFWMHYGEFNQGGNMIWAPDRYVDFTGNRLFASYSFRQAIDNWMTQCAKEKTLADTTRKRNLKIRDEFARTKGFAKGGFSQGAEESDLKIKPDEIEWRVSPMGEYWLDKLLTLLREKRIQPIFFVPPVPSAVQEKRDASGYDAELLAFVKEKEIQLGTRLPLIQPPHEAFKLSDFADTHHFSWQGSVTLSNYLHDKLPFFVREHTAP